MTEGPPKSSGHIWRSCSGASPFRNLVVGNRKSTFLIVVPHLRNAFAKILASGIESHVFPTVAHDLFFPSQVFHNVCKFCFIAGAGLLYPVLLLFCAIFFIAFSVGCFHFSLEAVPGVVELTGTIQVFESVK